MVWAMGFDAGLPVHIGHEELDGDYSKIEYVDTTFERDGVGGTFEPGDLHLGRAVKPDHVPTRIVRKGSKQTLPDVDWAVGMYFVNDRFKDVIERFEPGVHQFFPTDFLSKDGTLQAHMYFFNVCNRLDSVDRDLTTAELELGRTWRPDKGGYLVFNLRQIGKHHIWHDKHVLKGLYVSDALHDALIEAGITGLEFIEQRTA